MRKHIFVRQAQPKDKQQFVKWTIGNFEKNDADPEILKSATTFVLVAYDDSGPIAFLPVQQPLFLESLATRPDASPKQVATALKELVKAAVTQAHLKGIGEIYFISNEPTIGKFAETQLFKKLPMNIYRVKLSDLEGNHENL